MSQEVIDISSRFPHNDHLVAPLTLDGLGVNANANLDGSVTPFTFAYLAEPDYLTLLYRIIIYVQDTGNFNPTTYGAGLTLTNGYDAYYTDGEGHSHVIVPPAPNGVKSTGDLAAYMYDVNYLSFGAGDNVLVGRYTFARVGGPLVLDGDVADNGFYMTFNDNLTGLNRHGFTVEGIRIAKKHL